MNKKQKSNNKSKDKFFQKTVTVVINHIKIKKDPQRITKIKLFINKYIWK